MKKDFEKGKAALWTKLEKKAGIRVPEALKEKWEEAAGIPYDDGPTALEDLEGIIEDRLNELKYFETANYFKDRKKPAGRNPKKRSQRCFEKRLYLVQFVMKRYLAIANLRRKSSKSLYSRKRIDWKKICTEWDEAHPNDRMGLEVLKLRYYRAIAEKDIQREYIKSTFMRIPMDARLELFDRVAVIDPQGNARSGHVGSIVWSFSAGENGQSGAYTMDIRLMGGELPSEPSLRLEKESKSKGGTT